MSVRSAARRYAAVLFEVVQAKGDLARVENELNSFVTLVEGHRELQTVLAHPAIAAAKKRDLVEQILNATPDISGEVRRLLLMLAERDRLGSVADVAAAYTQRLMAHRKVMHAQIVTASALPDGQRAALAQALSTAVGADVRLNESVDPAIMGGIVARVGSVVYDASLTRQLEKMRQQLLARA
ncbi:MAG: ATP synthase F1 subunit delta [Vicinamibacterales bacterium]